MSGEQNADYSVSPVCLLCAEPFDDGVPHLSTLGHDFHWDCAGDLASSLHRQMKWETGA